MTLYLVGRASDNSVIIATDGQGVSKGNKASIVAENFPKYKKVADDLILCYSGSANSGLNLANIMTTVYEISQKRNPAKAAVDAVIIPKQDVAHLDSIVKQVGASAKSSVIDEYTKTHLVAYGNKKPAVALLQVHFGEGVKRYSAEDHEMAFPYRTGGINLFVQDILLEAAARGEIKARDSEYVRGLFAYLLQESSSIEEGIGGNFFFAALDKRGFREIGEEERMDIDLVAEEIRAELEGKLPAKWKDIQKNMGALTLAMRVNADNYGFKRMALSRLDAFESTRDSASLSDAVRILESGEQQGYLEPVVANAALGRAYLLKGDNSKAQQYLLEARSQSKGMLNNEMVEAALRALKGLVQLDREKYLPTFVNAANEAMERWGFTKEQIKAIK